MVTYQRALNVAGLATFVGILLPFAIFIVPQLVGASHSYVVLSASMSPTIHAGDVVIVNDAPTEQIQAGDIVTFEQPQQTESGVEFVTHRVVEVVERDDGRYVRTKGDANEEPDQALVPMENVVGRVWFTIPKIGYVIQFAGTGTGILVFVVAPAVLLVVNEVWTLAVAVRHGGSSDDGDETGTEQTERPSDGDD